MAIGERIRYIRNLRGMTQKQLGMAVGFPERTADVRLAQYEAGTRTPKADLTAALAHALSVEPYALAVPDIDTWIGIMHTLFTLEDLNGLKINRIDGEICLTLDSDKGRAMFDTFNAWQKEHEKFNSGEITKEEYDNWRYNYPRTEAERTRNSMDALRVKRKGPTE